MILKKDELCQSMYLVYFISTALSESSMYSNQLLSHHVYSKRLI
jgi:hypothetical protein